MLTTEARPLDSAGRLRSPAAMPGYHSGRPPRNKGIRYPADPPRVEEIVAVMREAGNAARGLDRRRGPNSGASRSRPASGGASLLISFATRMPSRWRARESR
jgi:hypothetical protein